MIGNRSPVRAVRGRALDPVVVREPGERLPAIRVVRGDDPQVGLVARVRFGLAIAPNTMRRPSGDQAASDSEYSPEVIWVSFPGLQFVDVEVSPPDRR